MSLEKLKPDLLVFEVLQAVEFFLPSNWRSILFIRLGEKFYHIWINVNPKQFSPTEKPIDSMCFVKWFFLYLLDLLNVNNRSQNIIIKLTIRGWSRSVTSHISKTIINLFSHLWKIQTFFSMHFYFLFGIHSYKMQWRQLILSRDICFTFYITNKWWMVKSTL